MDVACFVGYVAPRPGAIPRWLAQWLVEQGWLSLRSGVRSPHARTVADDLYSALLPSDTPVPIEAWSTFDSLFAWERRAVTGSGALAATYLGAAVRSFFAEGGRKCYVVSVGDPWPIEGFSVAAEEPALSEAEREAQRAERIGALIPGYPRALDASPADPESWHGIGHLFGLPDVSFVSLPDLADAVAGSPLPRTLPPVSTPPQQFLECSEPEPESQDNPVRYFPAPRCDDDGWASWTRALEVVRDAVTFGRFEAQLLAAVPMPLPDTATSSGFIDRLTRPFLTEIDVGGARRSSFVQLAYPWPRTRGSQALPEALESPDGVLAGVLARNALARGTYRSAAGLPLADVVDVVPKLPQAQLAPPRVGPLASDRERTLAERVTLLGRTPRGFELLSDVTLDATERYRPASVHRLVAAIVRAARRVGEGAVFEASGEGLWARVRTQLELLLLALYQDGALRGSRPTEAFDVRCDRTIMTQSDLDAGRVIAHVRFDAAAPIEQITVVLALDATGGVALLPPAEVA
jgi:hypothetical protein